MKKLICGFALALVLSLPVSYGTALGCENCEEHAQKGETKKECSKKDCAKCKGKGKHKNCPHHAKHHGGPAPVTSDAPQGQ